jgi:hypothetical protein
MDRKTLTTGYNIVLPKAGLNGFDWTFEQGSSFVLRLNFVLNSPPSAIPKPSGCEKTISPNAMIKVLKLVFLYQNRNFFTLCLLPLK